MAKKETIEIEAITINIGDTTVKVSPAQAKELYQALDALFAPRVVYPYPRWYVNGVMPLSTSTGLGSYTLTNTAGNESNLVDAIGTQTVNVDTEWKDGATITIQ